MSDLYESMRAFIRAEVRAEVTAAKFELRDTLTRDAPKVVEGPPGKNGVEGANGKDGKDGRDGIDGKPGERGADGIATREEIEEVVERKAADISVRTFADTYKGVYKPGELYTRGVLTTWGGSLWLSLADTKAKPGENPDWKLVVKK